MNLLIPFLILLFLPAVYVISRYNTLTALRNHIRESWANVDTELQRRHDLIPNLVATVKAYAAHERAVFEEVTRLRERCLGEHDVARLGNEEAALARATTRLVAVAEAYPEVKADRQFLKLHAELVNTEDRLAAARRFYNGNVRDYRNACQQFPSKLVADAFGFSPEVDYFQPSSGARVALSVA